jgi:ArsR family transcriptional regulator
LTEPLDLSQPTVSHHLKVLKDAGLIEVSARRGTWTFYRLIPGAMDELAYALRGEPVLV